jgi:hypothetical protein
VAALALALGVPAAGAATWKPVTSTGGSNIDQVSTARTPDGVLHVAWRRQSGPNAFDLLHTSISAGGAIGATTPIYSGWTGIENPALVWNGSQLRVFFGGIRTINQGDPDQDLETASSHDGISWTPQVGSVVPIGAQAYGSPVSATALPNGGFLEAWSATSGTWVHAGLSQGSANHDYQGPLGHYGYDAGIASNTAGDAVLSWYSNATGHLGVFAQHVNALTGAPVGPLLNMPGTSNMKVGMLGRTPIVARPGGGFYVAYATGYPALNKIMLWPVGGGTSLVSKVGRTGGTPTTTIAADSNGRLWVAWTVLVNGSPHVFVRRSNRTASYFGAVVDAGRPHGASSIYRLDANATTSSLDLFANTSVGLASTTSTYYVRAHPGLTLLAEPKKLHRGKKTEVTLTVLDARDPVSGAKVSAQGKSGRTNAKGKVTLTLKGTGRSVAAKATASGYAGAGVRLRVLRK